MQPSGGLHCLFFIELLEDTLYHKTLPPCPRSLPHQLSVKTVGLPIQPWDHVKLNQGRQHLRPPSSFPPRCLPHSVAGEELWNAPLPPEHRHILK